MILQVQVAGEHAAQVGEVGNLILRVIDRREGHEELDAGKKEHKVLCPHGENEEDEHGGFGEEHPEGRQEAVDCPRCPDGEAVPGKNAGADCGANTTDEIVGSEFFAPHGFFNWPAEHPEGEHIEENVGQVFMEKHVGDKLPELEPHRGFSRVESQEGREPSVKQYVDQEYCHIDNYQDLDDSGEPAEYTHDLVSRFSVLVLFFRHYTMDGTECKRLLYIKIKGNLFLIIELFTFMQQIGSARVWIQISFSWYHYLRDIFQRRGSCT